MCRRLSYILLIGLLTAMINKVTAIDESCLSDSGVRIGESFISDMTNWGELGDIDGGNHLYAFRTCELNGSIIEITLLLSDSDEFGNTSQSTTALSSLKAETASGDCENTYL